MKTKEICTSCKQDLSQPKEEPCKTCGWDFWFSRFLDANDWALLTNIHQSKMNELESITRAIKNSEESLTQIQNEIEQNEKKLRDTNAKGLKYERELSEKQKIIDVILELEKKQVALDEEIYEIEETIKNIDYLILNIVEKSTALKSIISIIKNKDKLTFTAQKAVELDIIMTIQQSKPHTFGVADRSEYFIPLKSKVVSTGKNKWVLDLTRFSQFLQGTYYINFINGKNTKSKEFELEGNIFQFTF